MHKITNPEIFRKNVSKKINEILEDDKQSINLEKGVFNYAIKEAGSRKIIKKWENPLFVQIYIDRLRSIYINLKNSDLLNVLKKNEITAQTLAFMTHQEMNHEHWRNMIERKIKRDASKFTTNVQASTDMFTCRRCKSKRTSYYEMQIRSADEPATIFITCLDCGKNFKR
jgi:DNA-directed RNA polymerase subunit M/transcription elongation factor TFIIS